MSTPMTNKTTPDEDWLSELLDKLWNDAWGKLGMYQFDGTGTDTLTGLGRRVLEEIQARKALEEKTKDEES
jgi:hypothetical protein